MNHIGGVINEYRDLIGLTRKELADDICSEKHIYLIEKGLRSPSVEMTRLLSDKLGIDLFGYYNYLDCKDPINVREYIEIFNESRRTLDFELMNKITQKAEIMHDFQNEPWSYEILINKLSYDILRKEKYKESIICIKDSLSKMKTKYSESIYIIHLYILLSTCYQITGELTDGKNAIVTAYEIIKHKQKNLRYKQYLISVNISMITIAYHEKDYDRVIEIALFLEENQVKIDSYERSHYVFFFLSFAYYQKDLLDKAIVYFEKGLYTILIYHKEIDMHFISSFETFKTLINSGKINRNLINKFNEKYN